MANDKNIIPNYGLVAAEFISPNLGVDYVQIYSINLVFLPKLSITLKLIDLGDELVPNIGIGDRSVDLKYNFVEETNSIPAISVGLSEIGGTNLLNKSYYIVTSKNFRIGSIILLTSIGLGKKLSGQSLRINQTGKLTGLWGNLNLSYKSITTMLEYDGDQFNTGIKYSYKNRIGANLGLIDFKHFTASLSASFSL